MAGTAGGGSGFSARGPCHCCQPLNILMATAICVPQAMLDFVNAIINGYPGSCGALPACPVLGVNDWVDAMAQARQAVMLIDFSNPIVPWSVPFHPSGPEWLGPSGTIQNIIGSTIQISNPNPPTDGICRNPTMRISTGPDVWALTPNAWFTPAPDSLLIRAFPTDQLFSGANPDFAGPYACTEINYDTLHYGGGVVAAASFAICDDTQSVFGPFAIATRFKVVGRDHVCVSGRKTWYPGVSSPANEMAFHWGPCGPQSPNAFGIIVEPGDPAAAGSGFDFTGFGPDQGGSDSDRWEQGLGAWIGQACQDCNCQ